MSAPKNVKAVCCFLGLTGFYRWFVPGYSEIAKPLAKLTDTIVSSTGL